MSDKPRRPDPEALKATSPTVPRHSGAPVAPPRKEKSIRAVSGPAVHVPDYLTKTEEAMEIQSQAQAFKERARQAPREEAPRQKGEDRDEKMARIRDRGTSLIRLSMFSAALAGVCLCVAAGVFFWPLFNSIIKGETVPRARGAGGGKGGLVVYAPGDTNTARGQKPGKKWSQGEGGKEPGAGAGTHQGGMDDDDDDDEGLGGLLSRIPLGSLGPERNLAFIIFSKPDKAEVILDGQPKGSTPVAANLTCRDNERVAVELQKPGFLSWEKVFRCKEGSIKVEAILKKNQ